MTMRCLLAVIDQVPYHKLFLKQFTHYTGYMIVSQTLTTRTLNAIYNVKRGKEKFSLQFPRQVRPKLDPCQGFIVLDGLLKYVVNTVMQVPMMAYLWLPMENWELVYIVVTLQLLI